MSNALFDPIKTQSKVTDSVIVAFSGGKDAIVTLDLCCKYFKNVKAFFMYSVKGLEYQEKVLRYYENRYDIEIERVPHFLLGEQLKRGYFTRWDLSIPTTTQTEMFDFVRDRFGIEWIAGGERASDSIMRRAFINKHGSIDNKSKRFYPIAYWNKNEVLQYIKYKKLYLGKAMRDLGNSANGLDGETLTYIKENFPDDYEKILKMFPFIGSRVVRFNEYGKK